MILIWKKFKIIFRLRGFYRYNKYIFNNMDRYDER